MLMKLIPSQLQHVHQYCMEGYLLQTYDCCDISSGPWSLKHLQQQSAVQGYAAPSL